MPTTMAPMRRAAPPSTTWLAWARALWCCVAFASTGCGTESGTPPRFETPDCQDADDCPEGEQCRDRRCIVSVCPAESARCSDDGTAIIRCEAEAGILLVPCRTSEICNVVAGEPTCTKATCQSGAWACVNGVAQHCAEDGGRVVESIVCTRNAKVCRDGRCVPEECPSDSVCEPGSCTPGARACESDVITECDEAGNNFAATGTDCAAEDKACFLGECKPRICEVSHICEDGVSYSCLDNGTRREASPCDAATDTFCNPTSGRCEAYVCLPGAALCAGDRATRCDDDGSGPLEGGVDCNAIDKGCWDGGCAPVLCEGEFVCNGVELLRCTQNGTALAHETECEAGTICDAELGACAPTPCTPNAPVCRGSVATTCRTSGMGFEPGGTDCAVAAKTCMAGLCVDRVCEPHALFCDGEELHQCDALGGSSSLVDECGESEACDAAQGACVPHICEPGQPLCDGDVLTTCALDGLGPAPGGEDCSLSGKVCDLDACKPLVCAPSSTFCDDEVVYQCHPSGSASAPVQVCENGTHCEDSVDGASCVTDS